MRKTWQKLAFWAATGALSLTLTSVVRAEDETLIIRSVPLEVSGYSEAATMDTAVKDAAGTVEYLKTTKPLIVHMEALRRAYHSYGDNAEEHKKLMKSLKERYMAEPDNAEKYFDYGYAQLVMDFDKNGLFFLRKANDKLASPYTNLAYGITQIDTDRLIEKKPVDEMTPRKMDAMYKLKDALTYNKEDSLPGIWPSFIHVLDGIKDYPAYDSLENEDMSTLYVPFGNVSLSHANSVFLTLDTIGSNPEIEKAAAKPKVVETCSFSSTTPNWQKLLSSKSFDMMNDGKNFSVNFFNAEGGKPYNVVVMNPENKVIGEFTSYKQPYIIEDVDNDGKFELVVRQFEKDRYHPLYVYRWNGSCFGEDEKVTAYFR